MPNTYIDGTKQAEKQPAALITGQEKTSSPTANIGYLGDVGFKVSQDTILTISNWKWGGSARYSIHDRLAGDALTEYTGLNPDSISFDILLVADLLGEPPMDAMSRLWKYLREGTPLPLTIGAHAYGRYRWNITDLQFSLDMTDDHGNVRVAKVSLTLQEYLRE